MNNIQAMYARQQKYMYYLLAILVLGWGLTEYRPLFAGLIIGTVVSFYGLWLLARKVEQLGRAVTEGTKAVALGTFSRFAASALAVLIAVRYEEHVQLGGVIFGLVTGYLVISIDFLLHRYFQSGEER